MTDHLAVLEQLAILLWHRFAPDDHIEWEDETHKAEYRDVAEAAIALMPEKSEVVAWIAPSSLESLRICRKDEHNGFVEAWMRRDDERTIPLCIAQEPSE